MQRAPAASSSAPIGKKSFNKNIKEFDKAAVFLDGNDQAIEFVAKMILHNCAVFQSMSSRSAVAARRSVSEVSCGNFLEMVLRVERGFCADNGLDERRRRSIGMSESPFEDAMNDEIGITANRRSEVRVFVEAKSEVTE